MRFAALGSGSKGNAWLVEHDGSRILIDCGFGPRETARRLARLHVEPATIKAVVVTHEHADHVGGVFSCARRYGWEVFMTAGTAAVCRDSDAADVVRISGDDIFAVGSLQLTPYTVPHDAREPVQFVVSDGDHRLGILTDAGHVTPHMINTLAGCDALVLECNHDLDLLWNGGYPPRLKNRIADRWGHLDNSAAASLLAKVASSRLRHVVAAHLSEENNTPQLACAALAATLNCTSDEIEVANQDQGLSWRLV